VLFTRSKKVPYTFDSNEIPPTAFDSKAVSLAAYGRSAKGHVLFAQWKSQDALKACLGQTVRHFLVPGCLDGLLVTNSTRLFGACVPWGLVWDRKYETFLFLGAVRACL